MADIVEGTILRAELTGKRYRVIDVDYEAGELRVEGLPSVSLEEVQQNIRDGTITIVR